ncbi:Clp protease N-terminal domain-containing protein [Actinomadura scrupuli]|uniref:Clp protease N-terminal domain-containing protein n=1 Tax=Actinomadura scrupuli TaxID=559629 RepID=UPI003D992217
MSEVSAHPRPLFGASVCLRAALRLARRTRSDAAGTHHLLLALLVLGDPVSTRTLLDLGIGYRDLCAAVTGRREWNSADGGRLERLGDNAGDTLLREASERRHLFSRRTVKPRWWTQTLRDVVDQATRTATEAGRARPYRAELLMSLLSHPECRAAEALTTIGTGAEHALTQLRLRHGHKTEAAGTYDSVWRPAGWVLRSFLERADCSGHPPGHSKTTDRAWRLGLSLATQDQAKHIAQEAGLDTPRPEHILLGLLGVHRELSQDQRHFGPEWQEHFPAATLLTDHGIDYDRAITLLDPPDDHQADSAPLPTTRLAGYLAVLRAAFAPDWILDVGKRGSLESQRLFDHTPRHSLDIDVLLLGVLWEGNENVLRMLDTLGADPQHLRQALHDSL